jgi:hypothetical protein
MSDPNGFVAAADRSDGLAGVFEDDGDTGYLYLYNENRGVVRHLHVYSRNARLNVTESDVYVCWSTDGNKCGVVILGKMRGIIDVNMKTEGRVFMETNQSPGIGDEDWLEGFEAFVETDRD